MYMVPKEKYVLLKVCQQPIPCPLTIGESTYAMFVFLEWLHHCVYYSVVQFILKGVGALYLVEGVVLHHYGVCNCTWGEGEGDVIIIP